MNEQEKGESREIFKQMLNCCCCSSCPCGACVHKDVCKYTKERPEKCEEFKANLNYKAHASIDQLFQPIFKWIQYHYPAGGVCFYVESDTAKMKIDHGPYVFDDKYKNCALTGFNSPAHKTEEKEAKNDA